jgi:hypothetical protein
MGHNDGTSAREQETSRGSRSKSQQEEEMKLYAKDGTQLKIGSKVDTFRGEKAEVRAMYLPHHPGSTGRVVLKFEDGSEGEYFPGVINAQWKDE